jgi:drug/metabolite transporter (DMT)-like permease
MTLHKTALTSFGSTTLFVLLWSSGAIFAKLGLDHASAFAFLVLRFALAFTVLLILGICRRRLLPSPRTRLRVAVTGLLLTGGYSICYLLALDLGITPGVLATVLGVQPILTLILLERRFSIPRLIGLVLAMSGLLLVVYQNIALTRFSVSGISFALAALGCMTIGAILQKGLRQRGVEVLPLQYGTSLLLCICFVPFQPIVIEFTTSFLIPLVWLGVVISVVAQLLFYRLIQMGNLVNVTSLFYLVPVVTAAMDYFFLGNQLAPLGLIGMGAILLGLIQVFRNESPNRQTGSLTLSNSISTGGVNPRLPAEKP